MSEENELQTAMNLAASGKRKESATRLLGLYRRAVKPTSKLQLIDALLSVLDPVKENTSLVDLSTEGISLAGQLKFTDVQAHFMARKADFLMSKCAIPQYERHNLKLSPGWLEFSTEADKVRYEDLTAETEKHEKEISILLSNAVKLAEESGEKRVLAYVLMSKASVESLQYLQYKMDCIPGNRKITRWARLLPGFDLAHCFTFDREQKNKLNNYVTAFTRDSLRAAQLFEDIDDVNAGYVYHNLANALKNAYKFRVAKRYLAKAKSAAQKYEDGLLSQRVEEMERAIKARNKDIPNYLEGETRETKI